MPEAGQVRLKTGQPELPEDEVPRAGDVLYCFSNTCRPRAHLLNGLPLRPNRNRSTYSFSHEDKTRRQENLQAQTFASYSCCYGRRFWRLTSWHISMDATVRWPPCSFSSPEWGSRLPFDIRATEDHIKAAAPSQLITRKKDTVCSSWNAQKQTEFLAWPPGSSGGWSFLILTEAVHSRSA